MVRRRICLLLTVVCGILGWTAGDALAQDERADIRYETVSPESVGLSVTYRLGIRLSDMTDGSLVVSGRDDYFPAKELRGISDPEERRYLRRGDVITHVDGVRIDSREALDRAMRSSGGRPRLTVLEAETGETAEWTIDAVRMLTASASTPAPDRSPKEDGVVRAVLIASTEDEAIGAAAEKTITSVRSALENALPSDRLEILLISGAACDARNILRQIERVVCRERDTLFVYVVARSGFDSRYSISSQSATSGPVSLDGIAPDDGQFFRLHEGDLLCRSLWERMSNRGARLAVLIADTCTTDSILPEKSARLLAETVETDEPRSDEFDGAARRGWAERLLGTTGRLDVRAASPGEPGWFDPIRGGWFTEALLVAIETADQEGDSDWESVLASAARTANARYGERRVSILKNVGDLSAIAKANLQAQTKLVPRTRIVELEADSTLDHLPALAD